MSSKSKRRVPELIEMSDNAAEETFQVIEKLDNYIALSNAIAELSECKLPKELILKVISKSLEEQQPKRRLD